MEQPTFNPNLIDYFEENNVSFKGEWIRKWCTENLNSEDYDIKFVANSIFYNYYAKSNTPNDNLFYYILISNRHKLSYEMRRDTVLSPTRDMYTSYTFTYRLFKSTLDNIDHCSKSILSSKVLAKPDVKELTRISELLEYRVKLLTDEPKIDLNNLYKYSKYTLKKLYSVYNDCLLDLEVLACNMF